LAQFDRKEKAVRIVSKQLLALEDIVMETESSGNTTLGFEQLRRWKDLTIQLLTETVSEMEASALRTKSVGPFVLGQPLRNFRAEASLYEAFLLSLNDSLQKHPDRILTQVHETGAIGVRTVVSTDLFISYSSKDAEFVTKLAKDLQSRGVSVWWDKWMMKVGDSLHKKIQEGITNSALLCVVLSPYSVSSPWVEKEMNSALMKELEQREVFVLPILYKECQIPLFLKDKLYADFRSSYEIGLSALLERLTPKIRLDLLEGLMSGSDSTISICYAKIRAEDRKLYSDEMMKRLDSTSVHERSTALTGLFTIRDEALPAHLMKLAKDSSDTVRRLAVFYLGELKGKYAIATISERLSDKSQEVRAAARVAYRKITGADA
jgi:hypothetical protein